MKASQKRLCMLSETIGPYNAIGRIAQLQVETALRSGYQVSVVAKRLVESLHHQVEWRKLYVPSRGFALQWLTGRHFIQKAMGDGSRYDLVWGHQPQIADLCDVYHCHYLTRGAYESRSFDRPDSLRRFLIWSQNHIVLRAEDRYYKRWNPKTHALFCSELIRRKFATHYGMPPCNEVAVNPAPAIAKITPQQRLEARQQLTGADSSKIVLGYLGGIDPRKGIEEIIKSLQGHPDIFLLLGGTRSSGYHATALEGHHRSVGLVENLTQFYAACDVFIVPSRFDPCPLVVFEAAAHGVPVIATADVGNSNELVQFSAGKIWDRNSSLSRMVREMHQSQQQYRETTADLCSALSRTKYEDRTQRIIEQFMNQSNPSAELLLHS